MKRRTRHIVLMLVVVLAPVLVNEASPLGATNQPESELRVPADSTSLDNLYVTVRHNIASYGAARTKNIGTRVIVALTDVNIISSRGRHRLERGQVAAFGANETYKVPTGGYFEVAFKLDHPPLRAPEQWIEPMKNTTVYEDEQIRVFEERLDGGDERPLHSHAQRVVVRLNEVQLTDPRFPKSERPGAGIQVPNTVRFAEPMVHVVKNLSEIPLFNIVLEFKIPRSK